MIITCAATTGFMIEYDNRYLWMNLKTLKGCHFANYREAWEANRSIVRGQDPPDAVGGVPVRAGRRGGRRRCTTTCTRASSACSCSRPKRGSASPTRTARAAPRRDHAVPPQLGARRRLLQVRGRPRHGGRDRPRRPRGDEQRPTTATAATATRQPHGDTTPASICESVLRDRHREPANNEAERTRRRPLLHSKHHTTSSNTVRRT